MNQNYYRNTWAEINLDAIHENIQNFRTHLLKSTKIMAAVKANGYGHGAVPVAKEAIKAGASYLAVALLDEAIQIREAGIKDTPILVLGWIDPKYASLAADYNISLTVFQSEWLKEVHLNNNQTLKVHLKFDTGMGRIGITDKKQAMLLLNQIKSHRLIKVEGVFTHFATADELDSPLVETQMERFKAYVRLVKDMIGEVEYIHCGNSAAALRFPNQMFNYVRIGIAMYGLCPSNEMKEVLPFELKPAFSFHSALVHVKKIKRGDTISYGATYTASSDEWVGTVPVGYGDGWIRKLAKKGEVLINGERAKIVGRICMDQFMVKLPQPYKVGEKVTLIGEQNNQSISADDIAENLETINYEIPCMIAARVPRIYIKNGQKVKTANPILNFS